MTYRAYLSVLVAVVAIAQATAAVQNVVRTESERTAVAAPPPAEQRATAPPTALAGGVSRTPPPAPPLPPADTLATHEPILAAHEPIVPDAPRLPVSGWATERRGDDCDPAVTVTCVAPAPTWDEPSLAP